MCGSLAQPIALPVPEQQPRRIWIPIPIPMEFTPQIPTFCSFWQYLV